MDKKKIVFFLPLMTSGGAERVTVNIINQLDRKTNEIHLILGTMQGDAVHLIPNDIEVHDLNSPRTLFSIFKLREKIKQLNPHILFSSLNRAHIAIGFALLGFSKKPKTIMRMPSSPKLIFKYNEMGYIFKVLLNFVLRRADRVVAQTPEMKEEIAYYHKVDTKNIKTLINPLDIKSIDINSNKPFSLFDKRYINIVASGRLTVEKGYDILLEAFAIVYKKNPNFRLYIIGANYGNEFKKYQQIINKHKIDNFVNFVGFTKNPYKFYKNSDLFVLSSRREGLPNAVLENLYLKKPVVATKCIPFMETIIENGKNGLLVDVENIEQLAEAILNFKKIDTDYKTIDFNAQSVKNIFTFNNK